MENSLEQRTLCTWFMKYGAKKDHTKSFTEWVAFQTVIE